MYLHRRIFFFFVFQHAFVHYSFLSLSSTPETCTILSCVCVFLSLYIFSYTCVAVLCVCSSYDHLLKTKRKQLHTHVIRIIYTCTCITFFCPSVFFSHIPLFLFIFFLLSFFSLSLFSTYTLQQKKVCSKNNERNEKKIL